MGSANELWLLQGAFTVLNVPVTWLELIAFTLALANIVCNVLEIHWGFALSLLASGLYAWFFAHSGIWGEASVNVFFALIALWGWWQWLYGRRNRDPYSGRSRQPLRVASLATRGRLALVAAWAVLWLLCAWALQHIAHSTVPWWDGFVTAGSIVGAVLLGRKFIENWPVWVVVNTASIGLFWYKELLLTTVLYAILWALAWIGWSRWHRIRI